MKYIAAMGMANCDILYGGMDHLPEEGTEVFSRSFDMQLGGGSPATLIALHRLGVPAYLATFLGMDAFSAFLEQKIAESGIRYENLYHGDKMPITVTSVMITQNDRTFASYQDDVPFTEEMKERVYEILAGAGIVKMHSDHLELYERLKREHPEIMLVLDFGWDDIRPIEELKPYFEIADYYTPNYKEALKITGTGSAEEAIRVLAKYFKTPIVKLDKDGCMVLIDGQIRIIPPLPGVTAVDSTGAGDAFMAGFLYGLYHGYEIWDCIRFGNVMGGKCVEHVGCLSRAVSEAELMEWARLIEPVEPV